MKILITIAILVAALGAGYFWFSNYVPGDRETPFTQAMKDKLGEYEKIHQLSPNLSVFDEELFGALKTVDRPETRTSTSTRLGRENPFAPF